MNKQSITSQWSFTEIWNNSLENYGERPMVPRDYIYASELGGSYVDRFLKMKGTKMTNPPNIRSRRKFQAGNIWEWIIQFVLLRAGILKQKQVVAKIQLPGCLMVSGKSDFVAGGEVDWERAEHDVRHLGLPEFIFYATEKIVGHLKKVYEGQILKEMILENKSASTYVMDWLEAKMVPTFHHALQNFHYIMAGNYDEGKLVYVCKDDCRLLEFPILNDETLMEYYKKDVADITGYYKADERPPLEPLLVWEEGHFRFNKNFKVEWSYYLTKLYGYKTPEEYRETYAPMVSRFNRVFKRCTNGDNLTKANKEVILEVKKVFPTWDDWVEKAKIAKAKGLLVEEKEEEE
jgi:hypothetical protein